MAAGDSVVSICNSALIALGEQPITSLNDPNKRAATCQVRYDPVRRAELRRHPWNCARTMVALAASTTAPVTEFDFAYPLPSDCLRALDLPDLDEHEAWEVQTIKGVGQCVLVNYLDEGGALNLLYVYDLQDPTQFDPLLTDTIAYALAYDIAETLTQSVEKEARMAQKLAEKRAAAMLATSQENSPPELDDDVLLRARR